MNPRAKVKFQLKAKVGRCVSLYEDTKQKRILLDRIHQELGEAVANLTEEEMDQYHKAITKVDRTYYKKGAE